MTTASIPSEISTGVLSTLFDPTLRMQTFGKINRIRQNELPIFELIKLKQFVTRGHILLVLRDQVYRFVLSIERPGFGRRKFQSLNCSTAQTFRSIWDNTESVEWWRRQWVQRRDLDFWPRRHDVCAEKQKPLFSTNVNRIEIGCIYFIRLLAFPIRRRHHSVLLEQHKDWTFF